MRKALEKALQLCVIPDREIGFPLSLEEQTDLAIKGGATMIQLRDKGMSGRELYETACRMKKMCKKAGVLLIVNDRFDVALASGADGAHLGRTDLPLRSARQLSPPGFILGGTAHSVKEAQSAEADGADYVGVGAAFPSSAKKEARVLGPEGIREVVSAVTIPAIAIGGISVENLGTVLAAGAMGAAVIGSVVGSKDISTAVRRMAKVISACEKEGR